MEERRYYYFVSLDFSLTFFSDAHIKQTHRSKNLLTILHVLITVTFAVFVYEFNSIFFKLFVQDFEIPCI